MIHIRLSDRYVDYSFDIEDKFTLVRGDSATGKTTLYELFDLYSKNQLNINCSGYRNLDILPEMKNYNRYADALNDTTDTVYILDESHLLFTLPGFDELLKSSNNYFIIMSREQKFKNLPVHLRSIKRVHSSGKYHTLQSIYTVPEDIHIFNKCVCEDSKSGKQFLQQFLPNVVSCSGKDNIAKAILANSDPLLIVYDKAGIGSTFSAITVASKHHKKPITHLAWECFESYIVNETLYKNAPQPEYTCEYNSYEKYATHVMSEILKSFPGINYSKSSLPHCLRKERCTSCEKTVSCPYVQYGDLTLVTGRLKKLIKSSNTSTDALSPELVERIWNQMPEAIKPEYGSTKDEIVANYYAKYQHLFV